MAYKYESEKLNIDKKDDKRFKISLEDREEIKRLYKSGSYSQYDLASMFGVSRTLIALYVNDNNLERHKNNQKNWKSFYSKEKHKEYMQRYRKRKYELYKDNKLTKNV